MHNTCVRYGGYGRYAFSLIMASHALRCFVLKTESISLRLTHALTHNRKNRCGNKGHKSRYARIFPRGKPTKGLEICTFCVFTTFVISRSRVQVTSPAPKQKTGHQMGARKTVILKDYYLRHLSDRRGKTTVKRTMSSRKT